MECIHHPPDAIVLQIRCVIRCVLLGVWHVFANAQKQEAREGQEIQGPQFTHSYPAPLQAFYPQLPQSTPIALPSSKVHHSPARVLCSSVCPVYVQSRTRGQGETRMALCTPGAVPLPGPHCYTLPGHSHSLAGIPGVTDAAVPPTSQAMRALTHPQAGRPPEHPLPTGQLCTMSYPSQRWPLPPSSSSCCGITHSLQAPPRNTPIGGC